MYFTCRIVGAILESGGKQQGHGCMCINAWLLAHFSKEIQKENLLPCYINILSKDATDSVEGMNLLLP